MTTEEQYQQVYEGICAVASRCDGARSKDNVGFDGQDTKFGRRIATVPFSDWTIDVREEASKIALKYRQQIAAYTGVDVSALDVVKDAQGNGTNYAARDLARRFEKLSEAVSQRLVDIQTDGKFTFAWAKKDPDFGDLLAGVKALPGRTFDWGRKVNVVPRSAALEAFIQVWDFPLTEAARKALSEAPQAAPEEFHVSLLNETRLLIDTPYDPSLVSLIRGLPGRKYIGGNINHADVSWDAWEALDGYGAKFHPDARAACELAREREGEKEVAASFAAARGLVLSQASRTGKPENLSPQFLELLAGALEGVA